MRILIPSISKSTATKGFIIESGVAISKYVPSTPPTVPNIMGGIEISFLIFLNFQCESVAGIPAMIFLICTDADITAG